MLKTLSMDDWIRSVEKRSAKKEGLRLDRNQTTPSQSPDVNDLSVMVDVMRAAISIDIPRSERALKGQFLTPSPVANLMASMVSPVPEVIRIADPGAGVGALTAALIGEIVTWEVPPNVIEVTAWEIDHRLSTKLEETLQACREISAERGLKLTWEIHEEDFIESAVARSLGWLGEAPLFDVAILNPPYGKIHSSSRSRQLVGTLGLQTTNLYSAFVALAVHLVRSGGQVVAIVPRSFTNGTYFKPFRQFLHDNASLQDIHLFESREAAFTDDQVLQENVIVRLVRSKGPSRPAVRLSTSIGPLDPKKRAVVPYDDIIRPGDSNLFIRIPTHGAKPGYDLESSFTATLTQLGITVSTGRVVEFRAREYLYESERAEPSTVPLIYPRHFEGARVVWPREPRGKPQAMAVDPKTDELLMPNADYVLVKRFSAKEEKRRVVAAMWESNNFPGTGVAFENHLNVLHVAGGGLDPLVARGICVYLNSSYIDGLLRGFNGHTQVNASDLRSLPYPDVRELQILGDRVDLTELSEAECDERLRALKSVVQ